MESFAHIITALMLALSSLMGIGDAGGVASPGSAELGISELSPRGQAGGFAMPASGCSRPEHFGRPGHPTAEDCEGIDITVDPPIIREDDDVEVCWYLKGRTDCRLLGDIPGLPVDPITKYLTGDGCETVNPDSDATYILICGDQTETATVRVLPRVQET